MSVFSMDLGKKVRRSACGTPYLLVEIRVIKIKREADGFPFFMLRI